MKFNFKILVRLTWEWSFFGFIILPGKLCLIINYNNDRKRLLRVFFVDWATLGRGKFDLRANAPCPAAISRRLAKEGILDMARGNVHFQQHAWGYFAFKPFLRCSDDGSLPLVEKICDSMWFRVANRLRVGKVRTAGCFSALPLLLIIKRVDFQKSPLSDIIWRGAKVDLSRLRRSR